MESATLLRVWLILLSKITEKYTQVLWLLGHEGVSVLSFLFCFPDLFPYSWEQVPFLIQSSKTLSYLHPFSTNRAIVNS